MQDRRLARKLPSRQARWPLHAALAAATLAAASMFNFHQHALAAPLEPPIVPTVHPAIAPNSSIPVSLVVRADQTSVWKSDLEQRMLVSGRVLVEVGYRQLRADNAAIWITPSRDYGENALDVSIYLSGHVFVAEGDRSDSTLTSGSELLVTTKISQNVQLCGPAPVSKVEETSLVFKRGDDLRQELLHRPMSEPFEPPVFTITTAEAALQAGWISKGPNNKIIAGPGDVIAARGTDGRVQLVQPDKPSKAPRLRPKALIATDSTQKIHVQQVGDEYLSIIHNPYMLLDLRDGSPPVEFHAQQMVLFSPAPNTEGAKTKPATTQPGAKTPPDKVELAFEKVSRYVTGVYLEGDVALDVADSTDEHGARRPGDMHVKATRIYVDIMSQRAIMLDATFSSVDKERNVPLYMRAEQIRMLSRSEFAAKKATFSTSEFYTPHYSIGAGDMFLQNLSPIEENGSRELPTFGYKIKDATVNISGVPVFYWPYLAGDTSKNEIPLRRIQVGNSRTYGLSLKTDWDLFGLAGQREPKGVRADLYLDYFSKRGPAAGVDSHWETDENRGLLRSYIMADHGEDRLGFDRANIPIEDSTRGRFTLRHMQDLDDGLTLAVEGSYISDPNFLEQYFGSEFTSEKEPETSIYLKKQGEKDALTFLGKFTLFDFTSTADQIDDQFTTEKRPEIKYWRIGDSFFDTLTYYSESSASYLHTNITNFTPNDLGLMTSFLGAPANAVVPALNQTYRQFYLQNGFTDSNVLRGDTRHELDLPIQVGDGKIVPYATGRITAWDDTFAQPGTPDGTYPAVAAPDNVRAWGQVGIRSSIAFWKTYNEVNSTFWDLHGLRHIIEPQFNLFGTGTNVDRGSLQPFDRDVEGISRASGMSLALNQKWQTKRGGEGHWRDVDWLVVNLQVNQFWNTDKPTFLYPLDALRGYYFFSRPELSLVRSSVAMNAVWRFGERARMVGEFNVNTDSGKLEQFATGLVIDQTDNLAYFVGNRYVDALSTDEWTVAVDYHLSRKYEIIAAESYDVDQHGNILSSVTIVRRLPRFNTGLTVTYDANQADTTVMFTAWPEGFPEMGFGHRGATSQDYK